MKQFDGVWFPEAVEVYSSSFMGGQVPQTTVRVFSAEFNRPEHPQAFTPEDIGIRPGMRTILLDGTMQEVDWGEYDGARFVPRQELVARQTRLQPDDVKTAAAETPTSRPVNPGSTVIGWDFESAWEAYTRSFIREHHLSDRQEQRAWEILRECQRRGHEYLAGKRSEFDAYARRSAALTTLSGPPEAVNAERAALDKMRLALRRPLDEIFERRLKPRLEALLTDAQRAAAQVASRPTGGSEVTRP